MANAQIQISIDPPEQTIAIELVVVAPTGDSYQSAVGESF